MSTFDPLPPFMTGSFVAIQIADERGKTVASTLTVLHGKLV
jgi:hypothetical protein